MEERVRQPDGFDIASHKSRIDHELDVLGRITVQLSDLSPAGLEWLTHVIKEEVAKRNAEPTHYVEDAAILYNDLGFSLRQLGTIYGVSYETIRSWLVMAGIKRREAAGSNG